MAHLAVKFERIVEIMMNHNESNALHFILLSMKRRTTKPRVVMNRIEGSINVAADYVVDGEDCNKHNYDDLSPFLHRRTKLSQG